MLNFFKLVIGVAIVMTMAGCEEQNTYQYLITHPEILSKKMEACAAIDLNASRDEIQNCKVIITASNQFMMVMKEQQVNPERFGLKVLTAQTESIAAKERFQQAKAKLKQLREAGANKNDIDASEKAVAEASKTSQVKSQEVEMLLAAVGLATPD